MSRVVHFEIQADDVERAKAFYAAVFDWSYQDYGQTAGGPYWGVITGPEDLARIRISRSSSRWEPSCDRAAAPGSQPEKSLSNHEGRLCP